MQKIFYYLFLVINIGIIGCAGKSPPNTGQETSALERLPFVYKMTVQQGNVLSADSVADLELGMRKRQVRFLLGTPLLTDFFHVNRWDYTYTIRRGHQPMVTKRLTLFFEDDILARIEGQIPPDEEQIAAQESQSLIVSVPDWQDRRGLLTRIFDRSSGASPD